jgi:CrcB protein
VKLWEWGVLAALGGTGALARFGLESFVASRHGGELPLGTALVNLTGAALLGLLIGLAADGRTLTLLGAGLLGSYTTFSGWIVQSHGLAGRGAGRGAALNVIGSLVAGLAAVAFGRLIGGGG